MYGYRRWGHNEADEPSFTQPLVYKAIEHRPSIRDSYLKHLLELGKVTEEEASQIADQERDDLEKQFDEAKKGQPPTAAAHARRPSGNRISAAASRTMARKPACRSSSCNRSWNKLADIPDGFHLHKKLQRSIERRQKMAKGEEPLDWSAAEALAFASLAVEGHPVRLSGQDSERGTFSQRHAVLHDVVDGHQLRHLQHLADDQAPVDMINSPLCEAGTMGFEYGYSLDYPEALVLWEAQYGDFVNAAQVIIDQFIASAEDKWRRLSGVVLLLPHAFEGKGPEHSSARLERFLLSAAEDNMQIVYPSTPAQYFHCLRRQVKRNWRKPLVVLTPKSLLRHPHVVSPLERPGQRPLPPHPRRHARESVATTSAYCSPAARCITTSSKPARNKSATTSPSSASNSSTRSATKCCRRHCGTTQPKRRSAGSRKNRKTWAPGPTGRIASATGLLDRYPFSFVARTPSASPATGSTAAHHREQDELITRAFRILL